MGDQRLRERERRRGETADDQAAWLVERLRTGSLTRERLDLAAWCGDEAAIRAGGTKGPDEPGAWLRGLERHSPALAIWGLAEVLRASTVEPGSSAAESRLERLRLGARDAFLRDELLGWVDRELTDLAPHDMSGDVKRILLALHHLARSPRLGDPTDPDVLRAIESVRPRFPYLDPGSWAYAWSERRRGVWAHRLRFTRVKGGESPHLVDAAAGWAPPPGAAWAGPRALDDLILGEDWPSPPARLLETATAWALGR